MFRRDNLEESCEEFQTLPPCRSELQQHILRTTFIAKMWTYAYSKLASTLSPEECGWSMTEMGSFEFQWFVGSQVSESVEDIELEEDTEENG